MIEQLGLTVNYYGLLLAAGWNGQRYEGGLAGADQELGGNCQGHAGIHWERSACLQCKESNTRDLSSS